MTRGFPVWNPVDFDATIAGSASDNAYMELLFPGQLQGQGKFRVDHNGNVTAPNLTSKLQPTGDPTGARDTALINAAAGLTGLQVVLGPGTWYVSGAGYTVTGQGAELTGTPGAIIQPVSGITGPYVTLNAEGAAVRKLGFYGGTNTATSNPAADVISIGTSALRWWVEDLDINYCNGWPVALAASGASHGTIRGIKGTGNLNGVKVISATPGTGVAAQVAISDIDLQSIQSGNPLEVADVTDVSVTDYNAGTAVGVAANGAHLSGGCQTIKLSGLDFGGGTGTSMLIEDANGHSPTDITVSDSTFQESGIGVKVTGGASRLKFTNVTAKGNNGDNWQFAGTGSAIVLIACAENTGNGGAGTAYGVNITSTARVAMFGMQYISTGTTARRNITSAGNHVLDLYPENLSGLGIAGNAPNGWSATQPQTAQANPGNPGSTTSATLVMMGLGASCAITPQSTGKVLVTISGGAATATAIVTFNMGARYGTGTHPNNGDAVTGTRFGGTGDQQMKSTGTAATVAPFSLNDLLTLTPGTTYWFDIALSTTNAADAAELLNVSFTAVEIA